jgi:hypothetical protein
MSKGSLLWSQSITDVAHSSDYKWRLHSTHSIRVISFSKAEYVLICPNRNNAIFRFRRTKSALAYLWLSVFFPHGTNAFSGPEPPYFRGFTTILWHTTLHRTPLCLSLYPVKYVEKSSKFKVCKSAHQRTIQIDHQSDATIFQFIILTYIYSSTCFERSPAHHQELNDCSGSLWFNLRIVVIAVPCSWSGRSAFSRPSSGVQRMQ